MLAPTQTCSICYDSPFPFYTLPCQHAFCGLCVLKIRTECKRHVICAICRDKSSARKFLKWLMVKLRTFCFEDLSINYNQQCNSCRLHFKFVLVLDCNHNICPSCAITCRTENKITCPVCFNISEKIQVKNILKHFGYGKTFY